MTKESQVTLKLNLNTAAAIRQILFEHQKGYTYDEQSTPPRISVIRSVISDIDKNLEKHVL